MKRSEFLTIIGIILLATVLFVSNGQLSWAAPDQTPHMQTVPPRPPDEGEEEPPAPPEEEPAPTSDEPPAEDSPTSSDDGDSDGGSSNSPSSSPAEPVSEPTQAPSTEVSEEAVPQAETPQEEPQAESVGAPEEPVSDQATETGSTTGPVETGSTTEATVEDGNPSSVEEPESAITTPSNSRSQNVAFEEKVSQISAEAMAEAAEEPVPGEVAVSEQKGFPLYWLVALGVGLVLIVAGTVIIKRA